MSCDVSLWCQAAVLGSESSFKRVMEHRVTMALGIYVSRESVRYFVYIRNSSSKNAIPKSRSIRLEESSNKLGTNTCACSSFHMKSFSKNFLVWFRYLTILLQHVGCDDRLYSSAREDRCGVCRGDGSTCETRYQSFDQPHGESEFQGRHKLQTSKLMIAIS